MTDVMKDLIEARAALAVARTELDEMQALHDIQWRRMREATTRWQKAHPEIKDVELTWPDLGEMLFWLLEEPDRAVKSFADAIRHEISHQRDDVLMLKPRDLPAEQILSELSMHVAGLLAGREWSKTHGG